MTVNRLNINANWKWMVYINKWWWTYNQQSNRNRRKFRSQTSDNMDRWNSRGGKSQRREAKRREEERREEKRQSQKKEDVGARKNRKVAKHCVFQWSVAPEGRKVGSLKRRVRSHLARWEMKNCTPLWRSILRSQNAKNTPGSEHFWKLRWWKSARRCGAKHIWKWKC